MKCTDSACTLQGGKGRVQIPGTMRNGPRVLRAAHQAWDKVGTTWEAPKQAGTVGGGRQMGNEKGLEYLCTCGSTYWAVRGGAPHHWLRLQRACVLQCSEQLIVRRVQRLCQSSYHRCTGL